MGLLDFLKRKDRATPVTPQMDRTVAQRLAAAGKDPATVQATPAEPLEIPSKPLLPGFEGMVRFELTIDDQGKVRAVAMDDAPPAFVSELEAWAHAWTFEPARMEGKAHPCRMVYEVHWSAR
ncbi:MAG TPA: hypothetical protein VJ600_05030 [Holophagaceae bacterium]|nr:hypothetical protein [Holophagaceae bacterium]